MHPGALPEQLESLPWPQHPAAGRPKVEGLHASSDEQAEQRDPNALQFQYAKKDFEEKLRAQEDVSYSIVRATAFFKSVSGQLEVVNGGAPPPVDLRHGRALCRPALCRPGCPLGCPFRCPRVPPWPRLRALAASCARLGSAHGRRCRPAVRSATRRPPTTACARAAGLARLVSDRPSNGPRLGPALSPLRTRVAPASDGQARRSSTSTWARASAPRATRSPRPTWRRR